MNSLLAIILITGSFIASGWYLTFLFPSAQKIERLGLAFLLGAGSSTFFWFLSYRMGLSLNIGSFALVSLLIIIVSYGLTRILHVSLLSNSTSSLSKGEKYLAYTIVFLLLSAFIIGSYNPLSAWDSIALYDFRAHAIAISHSLSDFTKDSYYISYPLMTSLVHVLVYMLGGENAQGIHAVIFTSFIAIVYGRLSDWLKPAYALMACFLIIVQSEIFSHATFAYTNLPYTSYLIIAFLYAVSPGRYSLVLSGLLFGLSTWVRAAEIFWIVGLLLLLYQGIKSRQIPHAILGGTLILLTRYGWTSYTAMVLTNIGAPVESLTTHANLSMLPKITHNLPAIMRYINEYLVKPYLVMWLLVVPCIVVYLKRKNLRLLSLLGALFVSTTFVILGVMIFSTYYETWNEIGDSAKRMILFVIPYTIIMAVYAFSQISTKVQHEK